ncbi:DUF4384 domain-containing protein [Desulfomarina sp.]
MKTKNRIVRLIILIFLALPAIFFPAAGCLARQTFYGAAERLFQGVEQGRVVGFVELTGSNGESSKLSAEIFQQIEPVLIRVGMKRKLSFIEKKNLKLIFDEWALNLSGATADAGAGTLLGTDYIITGKVRLDGGFVQCSLKLIDLKNGKIVAVAEGYLKAQPYYYQWEDLEKDMVAGDSRTASNRGESSDGMLRFWTDKEQYFPGDTIKIFFEVTEPLFVQIIDVTPDGEVTVIYPNVYQPGRLCEPGRIYRVPPENGEFILEVTPPAGVDRLKALASTSPFPKNFTAGTRGIRLTKKIVDSAAVRAALSFKIGE